MADFARRAKFIEKLQQRLAAKNPNSFMFSDVEYNALIDDLDRINRDGCKNRSDYRKKCRFEVKAFGPTKKLVKRGADVMFLPSSELYDQIHTK